MSDLSSRSASIENIFWLASCTLVTGMLTCAAVTVLSLVDQFLPDWQPIYLPFLVAFCVFERLYTYHATQKLTLFSKAWMLNLAAEWVVIGSLAKVVVGLSHGAGAFMTEISNWRTGFPGSFLSPDFLFGLGLVIVCWFVAGSFAETINGLGLKQALILQEAPAAMADTQPARERLLNQIVNLGVLLVVLTALMRVDLRSLSTHSDSALFIQLPALAGGGASSLLYFLCGLALFGLSQLMELQTRWSLLNIPVSPDLARRWLIASLFFFGILAGSIALLPTSYSLGILGWLGSLIGWLTGMFFMIGQVLLSMLLFLLSLPLLLLGNKSIPPQTPPPLPTPSATPANLPIAPVPPAWLELAKAAVFWLILGAILAFSIVQYLRQHREIFQALRKLPGASQLAKFMKWVKACWKGTTSGFSRLVEASRVRLRQRFEPTKPLTLAGFINLGRLDPRQKVTFYYQALLRRGKEQGLPRQASQTPFEYASRLETALPGVEPDIEALTEAFIEARYSRHPLVTSQASLAQAAWEKIRKALREKLKR